MTALKKAVHDFVCYKIIIGHIFLQDTYYEAHISHTYPYKLYYRKS